MYTNKHTLKITRSWYVQGGEVPTDIPCLHFHSDGSISLEGNDPVGQFVFSGKSQGEFLLLTKQYFGKHSLYYAGKMEGNTLNLFYDFNDSSFQTQMQNVENYNFNAGIIFDQNDFANFRKQGKDAIEFAQSLYRTQGVQQSSALYFQVQELKKIPLNEQIPNGWRIITLEEAKLNKEQINALCDNSQWFIVAFETGQLDGHGYGNNFHDSISEGCGEKVIVRGRSICCPNYHPLIYVPKSGQDGYTCNSCGKYMKAYESRMECRPCNWDLCDAC